MKPVQSRSLYLVRHRSMQTSTVVESHHSAATKTLLRVSAAGLKLAPIPLVDEIPSMLLQWIEIYEVRPLCTYFLWDSTNC